MKTVLGLATCFNRKEKTVNALNRLISGNPEIRFSFIITDDGSSDGTSDALRSFENVTVLHGDGNLYYSGGMRMAIDAANAREEEFDYCLLFNDDVEFYDHCIEYLASLKEDVIWVGPTCDKEGRLVYSGINRKPGFKPAYTHLLAESSEGVRCETLNGNCVLIPWRIFKKLPNIPEVYHHSFGDYEYGFAATRMGFEMRVPDRFIGMCKDDTPSTRNWKNRDLSIRERLKLKESVKGLPFREYFYYLHHNFGLPTALVYSATPYIKIMLHR
ncbi:MAG: glycosyltransferase [Solobacterium sp.]|nr:glycosyltransferase [Solobacterium sp.]